MAYSCALCKKGSQYGRSSTHHRGVAGAQWKKRAQKTLKLFRPNLHVYHMSVDGVRVKVKLCTKCLRKIKGQESAAKIQKTATV